MAIQSPSLELGAPLVQPTAAAAGRGYWQSVARRLRRDPVTVICAAVLLLLVASALAAPWLGLADPYKTSMLRRLYPLGSPNHHAGHRRARPRHALPPDLWRAAVAVHGRDAGASAPC